MHVLLHDRREREREGWEREGERERERERDTCSICVHGAITLNRTKRHTAYTCDTHVASKAGMHHS